MRRNYLNFWSIAFIFLLLFTAIPSIQSVNAIGTTSNLTVTTQDLNGAQITGIYIQLYQNGIQVASGYSPATFILSNDQTYTVIANNYLTYIFDHWLDTGSTSNQRDISISSNTSITGVYKTTSSTVTVVPRPPTGLAATAASSSQINLSWTAPTDNGGSPITGYKIYRGIASNGEGTTPIATVSNSTLSYADTGLANGQTYYYEVTAVNSVGESSPSNEASATPEISNSLGITVYAHRIPASYWDPCFATTCSAGTGPGAKMEFALLD
ncbi:MAG TPA: fibronectin type III domain-containing protein, partial [Candidatus Nitrosotalea sp.]|nr:fibronectin type III domain-containing protein [Candidatus Nitrosotalea sp.]